MKKKHLERSVAKRFKRFVRKGYGAFNSLHRVVNIGVVSGAVLCSAYVSTVSAQNVAVGRPQSGDEKEEEQLLEEVMVTASKVATPINRTAKLVTVVTQKEIAKAPVRSIQDLLVYMAGVDVAQRGGHGVQADISIRGGSFDQNIVLLNGINLSSAQSGHLTYDIPINLSDIERIEIIHGPAALIYGAGAFSGGINIITKKEAAERIFAQISAGQHKLIDAEARGAVELGNTVSSLSLSRKSSDGYRENTDYRIYNALWQTRLAWANRDKIDFQLGYNNKEFGANAFYSPKGPLQFEKTRSLVGSVRGEFGDRLRVVPIVYWNRTHDEYHWQRGTPLNHHRADNIGGNLIFTYASSWGTTSLGSELRREDILSTTLGYPTAKDHGKYNKYASRTNASVSLEHTLALDKFVVSAGGMLNHNTQRDGKVEFCPSVSTTYRPDGRWAFSGSWSKSVRIPTFTDLFYKGPKQTGNADLRAEHSESAEIGVKFRTKVFRAYLTGFGQWGRDMIDWAKLDPADEKYQSVNLSRLDTYGVEAGAHLQLGDWLPFLGEESALKVDYLRMTQRHDSEGLLSLYALRYLRDKLTVRFNHGIVKNLTASWSLRWQKRMGQYESGTDGTGLPVYSDYPAFATLDLKLDYRLRRDLGLNLSINNLTNKEYFDIAAVPQPGFWASVGVSYLLRK